MAKEKGKKQAEDLEVSAGKAEEVKGGRLESGGGGGIASRGPAIHHRKRGHKAGPSAPAGGMPHK